MNAHSVEPAEVWRTLAAILDPEFAIGLVDLGLIYGVACDGSDVTVDMTLTTPDCPSGLWIHEGVRAAVGQIPGVKQVTVNLLFEPRWTPEMLSEEARRQLAWEE